MKIAITGVFQALQSWLFLPYWHKIESENSAAGKQHHSTASEKKFEDG